MLTIKYRPQIDKTVFIMTIIYKKKRYERYIKKIYKTKKNIFMSYNKS